MNIFQDICFKLTQIYYYSEYVVLYRHRPRYQYYRHRHQFLHYRHLHCHRR